MLLFPNKLNADLAGVPIVTTLVGLASIILFLVQTVSWQAYESDIDNFCQQELRGELRLKLARDRCIEILVHLDFAENPAARLAELQHDARFNRLDTQDILTTLQRLHNIVPKPAITQWWLPAGTGNPWQIIVASVTHTSLMQLLLNLVFLFTFGVFAELMLGHLGYGALVVISALLAGWLQSGITSAIASTQSYFGLSGVVTATILATILMNPRQWWRWLFWLVFFAATFQLPEVIVSVGYTETVDVAINGDRSRSNLGAHLAGAVCGAAFALSIRLWLLSQKSKMP